MLTKAERRARHSAWDRTYRQTHPEKWSVYRKTYRLAHPERVRAQQKAARRANPDRIRAENKAYRLAHLYQLRAKEKARYLAHPETNRVKGQRHRARKLGLPNTLTVAEWDAICAAYKGRCAYCGKKRKLTMDHVLPLSKGGGTIAFNIVPSCQSCNSAKGARLPVKPLKLAMGI